jgi:peptidoglycan/xylan/chitin deacetylase (PgdA/CDA1 family)
MNTIPREICKQAGRFMGIKRLLEIKRPVFLPFYHVVSDEKLPHILNYNYRNTTQFEKEIDFYLKYFKPVGLKELVNGDYSDNAFHLSFDDGLRECYDIIAPVLLRKGIPASFFVNPGFVDNKALFHKYKASLVLNALKKLPVEKREKITEEKNINFGEFLQITVLNENVIDELASKLEIDFDEFLATQQPYLTSKQILELKNKEFSIGAHSFSHPEFWKIDEVRQVEEIGKSMEWLDTVVQPEIKSFAFPFTDSGVPKQVLETMFNKFGCDISFGTAGVKYDELANHFQRYPVEQPGDFLQNLKGEFVYLEFRKWIGKSIVEH